jgi:prepilin-type N-terminal cleavage/methylation domain-containing protein
MIANRKSKIMTHPMLLPLELAAFTLVELLVVMAVIAILASLLLPALAAAREKAKVCRVHTELYGIGLALEMYSTDHHSKLPPVRVNCNSDLRDDWCELPVELANEGYLPHGPAGREANMEDIFNRGHTYKYAAPGPELLNGGAAGNYKLWVPTNFPVNLGGSSGQYYTNSSSPVRWIIWSLGPQPKSQKTMMTHSPMTSDSWYRQTGDGGVIVRYADCDGRQFNSP